MQTVLSQIEVITHKPRVTSSGTKTADDAEFEPSKGSSQSHPFKQCQAVVTTPAPSLKHARTSKIYDSMLDFVLDESLSTIPIFMRYFAFHECVVLTCGGVYYLQPDTGALCISIVPGLSIIGMFVHFLRTQFRDHKAKQTFSSARHYAAALMVFVCGAASICVIYRTNTYLSTLVPSKVTARNLNLHQLISHVLEFPHRHSFAADLITDGAEHDYTMLDSNAQRPFNYRLSFVGSIIAPVIEETSKFLLLSLTFPMTFLWQFTRPSKSGSPKSAAYAAYCRESLFIMFIALCGGCGIAIMENIGYLAACQWSSTRAYCLPNKNFDILGAGLARGIFSVPFHCVTACILADALCAWMHCDVACLRGRRWLKFIVSYPMALVLPVVLHSSFNFWMKGLPFMTGVVTIVGFGFLAMRIAQKHTVINKEHDRIKMNKDEDGDETETSSSLWYGEHASDAEEEDAVAL